MGMPAWWEARRYGLFVHASLASVPAWAPIGQDASWYRWHLGDNVPPGSLQPMAEVVAHHRDRWGHISQFDDFFELLTFDRFDPDEWAQLALDAGAGYAVIVAKHRDGLCWWDAPQAGRRTVDGGPRRNIVAEFAAACERSGLIFGTHHAAAEWDDDSADDAAENATENAAGSQAIDLVERYGSRLLRSDRTRAAVGERATSAAVLDRLRAVDPELIVNDRWCPPGTPHAPAVVRSFDDVPSEITAGPWELCCSVGRGFGHNRADRHEHHLTGYDIVALLTEVVAKGGHLLLSVGAQLDGSIGDMQADPVRDAGTWVGAHRDVIDRSEPWETWGDADVRYVTVDGVLHVIDLTGTGRFRAIAPGTHRVVTVQRLGSAGADEMHFTQDESGVTVDLPRSSPWRRSVLPVHGHLAVDVAVYRVDVEAVEQPGELFAPVERRAIDLAPLLADVSPGEIVQLGDAVYCGPADVPPGVILRGLGPDRTRVDARAGGPLRVGRNSRVEHLTVIGGTADDDPHHDPHGDDPHGGPGPSPAVVLDGQFATLLGCDVRGHTVVTACDASIRASTLVAICAEEADRLTISRCQLRGRRWDVGVHLVGGSDHEVDSCELSNHLCAIRATDTTGTVVRGNDIEARWWGVHFERTERAHAHGNRVRNTMRAVDVDGGTAAVVDGNAVLDGDSGCVVERGASDCRVAGNHWERCRLGLLAWDATGLHHQDNHVLTPHEPENELIIGP